MIPINAINGMIRIAFFIGLEVVVLLVFELDFELLAMTDTGCIDDNY